MVDDADKRSYRTAITLLAVGACLLFVGFALPWATAQLPLAAGVEATTRSYDVSGSELFPGAAASAWVCVAAIAGILATRSWGRRLVGLIVVVAGVVAAIAAATFAVAPSGFVDSATAPLVGPGTPVVSTATGWWAVSLLGAVLAVTAGGWTVARGSHWPSMGSRYERTPRSAAEVNPWDALDKGEDPTDDLVE